MSELIWDQHAANKRTRTATSKVTKSVSIARWQGTQLVFDDYFLYFSAWVGDHVIHILKAYWILNPLIVKSFFCVTYEAHSSLIKNNTHNLIIAFDHSWPCTHENAILRVDIKCNFVFDDYFLNVSAWVCDRVIHHFKAY